MRTGRQEGEDGDWDALKDALKEINLNLQSDLMEGILKRNSGRGGNDVLSGTEGNTGTGAVSVIGGKGGGSRDREI